jgi:hypothetical protein
LEVVEECLALAVGEPCQAFRLADLGFGEQSGDARVSVVGDGKQEDGDAFGLGVVGWLVEDVDDLDAPSGEVFLELGALDADRVCFAERFEPLLG